MGLTLAILKVMNWTTILIGMVVGCFVIEEHPEIILGAFTELLLKGIVLSIFPISKIIEVFFHDFLCIGRFLVFVSVFFIIIGKGWKREVILIVVRNIYFLLILILPFQKVRLSSYLEVRMKKLERQKRIWGKLASWVFNWSLTFFTYFITWRFLKKEEELKKICQGQWGLGRRGVEISYGIYITSNILLKTLIKKPFFVNGLYFSLLFDHYMEKERIRLAAENCLMLYKDEEKIWNEKWMFENGSRTEKLIYKTYLALVELVGKRHGGIHDLVWETAEKVKKIYLTKPEDVIKSLFYAFLSVTIRILIKTICIITIPSDLLSMEDKIFGLPKPHDGKPQQLSKNKNEQRIQRKQEITQLSTSVIQNLSNEYNNQKQLFEKLKENMRKHEVLKKRYENALRSSGNSFLTFFFMSMLAFHLLSLKGLIKTNKTFNYLDYNILEFIIMIISVFYFNRRLDQIFLQN